MHLPQARKLLLCLILCLIPLGPCQNSLDVRQIVLNWKKPATSEVGYWLRWGNVFHQASYECLARVLVRHHRTFVTYEEALTLVYLARKESKGSDEDLLQTLAVIVVESGAQKRAVSEKNARGLMQILPETGAFIARAKGERWRGSQSLFEPETNIRYGVWYIEHLQEMFAGNEKAALAAYNWGPGAVQARMKAGEGLPKIYPRQVLAEQEWLRKEWYNEHVAYFWRRVGELQRHARNGWDPSQPEDRPTDTEVSLTDGESVSAFGG